MEWGRRPKRLGAAALALAALVLPASGFAQTPRVEADARLRLQLTDEDGLDPAEALTLRVRAGAEIDIAPDTVVLGELEGAVALIDDFDDGTRFNALPFIPDPDGLELNRLQVATEAIPKTRITAGRQRIAIDDWRFFGTFPFRQNDQTVDGARVQVRDIGPIRATLDAGGFWQVNRPLGRNNPAGRFRGESFYANLGFPTALGRVSLFHYHFDIALRDTLPLPDHLSSATTGARLFGRRHTEDASLVWEAAYARQVDAADNPLDYATDYFLGELTGGWKGWNLTARAEELGSDNGVGLTTPLASLHRFQGSADRFLMTPPDGVRDVSLALARDLDLPAPFENGRALVRHHQFTAATDNRHYGSEWDASVSARLGATRLSLEVADYHANGFATDTRSVFVTAEWSF